jgi:membrane-associated phospholipid phosphatase
MSRLQRWGVAFAITVAVVAVSYVFFDRPIAYFAHEHLRHYKFFVQMTKIPEPFAALGAVLVVVFGLMSLARPLSRWQLVVFTASITYFSGAVIKSQLKLVFGRTWPETWVHNNPSLIRDGAFGFNLFHGGGEGWESFPSGHTTGICTVMAVLWIAYPRFRPLYAVLIAAVAIGLIGANYHFLSDIIAGGFLGASVGIVASRFAGLMPAAAATEAAAATLVSPPVRS